MKALLPKIGITSLLALACCAVCVVAAPLFAPQPGLLVLKNGQVIEGGILREGDRYIVTLGERGAQGEVKVPVSDVDFVCGNLDEAYQRKREAIRYRDVQLHLKLAEWCIRQGLNARAADELVAAMAIDPLDPRIAALERRLKILAEPAPSKELPVYVLPPSQTEIAAVIRTLPEESVEHFTEHVEPMLLSRCAATGCHGPNTTAEYRLVRPPLRHVNKLRETQRNAFASLQQIGDGGESPLLNFATKAHGSALSPPLDDRDRRMIDRLAEWIEMVRLQPAEKPGAFRDENVQPAMFEQPLQGGTRAIRRLPTVEEPKAFAPHVGAKPLQSQPSPLKAAPLRRGGGVIGPAQESLSDPFDPAAFNQRYHPEKPAPISSPLDGK
jgi:hypothetical protein